MNSGKCDANQQKQLSMSCFCIRRLFRLIMGNIVVYLACLYRIRNNSYCAFALISSIRKAISGLSNISTNQSCRLNNLLPQFVRLLPVFHFHSNPTTGNSLIVMPDCRSGVFNHGCVDVLSHVRPMLFFSNEGSSTSVCIKRQTPIPEKNVVWVPCQMTLERLANAG